MRRDPRVNLLVHQLPGDDGLGTYATISGTVELTEDPGGSFHQAVYDLHMAGATPLPVPDAELLIVRITPEKVYVPPVYVPTPGE